jgi:hypothetical protein
MSVARLAATLLLVLATGGGTPAAGTGSLHGPAGVRAVRSQSAYGFSRTLVLEATRPAQQKPPAEQSAHVKITAKGFEPAKVELLVGVPAKLTFTRVTDATCAKEIVFPSLKLRKPLPLNQAVNVRFTPAAGETAFVCGMDMLKGTVTAR